MASPRTARNARSSTRAAGRILSLRARDQVNEEKTVPDRRPRARSLPRHMCGQASTRCRKRELMLRNGRGLVRADRVLLAGDLPPKSEPLAACDATRKEGEPLRIVFLSRVSKMKNLEFAIEVLKGIDAPIVFDIFGPVDRAEEDYWEKCRTQDGVAPGQHPGQVPRPGRPGRGACGAKRLRPVAPPTRGENFGHVIFEALAGGSPSADQRPHRMDRIARVWRGPGPSRWRTSRAYRRVIDELCTESLAALHRPLRSVPRVRGRVYRAMGRAAAKSRALRATRYASWPQNPLDVWSSTVRQPGV